MLISTKSFYRKLIMQYTVMYYIIHTLYNIVQDWGTHSKMYITQLKITHIVYISECPLYPHGTPLMPPRYTIHATMVHHSFHIGTPFTQSVIHCFNMYPQYTLTSQTYMYFPCVCACTLQNGHSLTDNMSGSQD